MSGNGNGGGRNEKPIQSVSLANQPNLVPAEIPVVSCAEDLYPVLASTVTGGRGDEQYRDWVQGSCPVCKAPFEAKIKNGLWRFECPGACPPSAVLVALGLGKFAGLVENGTSLLDIALWIQSWGKAPIPLWNSDECDAGKCSLATKPDSDGICTQPGKHPRVRWKHYQDGSPPMVHELRQWWREWPDANIAVLTGKSYDLAVLDLDDAEAQACADEIGAVSPVATRTGIKNAATGWRGEQRLFRFGDLESLQSVVKLKTASGEQHNMDSRGDGGIFVFPGSMHRSGVRYERLGVWPDAPFSNLPAFPRHLFPGLDPSLWKANSTGGATVDTPLVGEELEAAKRAAYRYITAMGGANLGHGSDHHAFKVGCVLVRDFGLSVDQAMEVAAPWNKALCKPEIQPHLLRAKFENAEKYAKKNRGNKRRGAAVEPDEPDDIPEINSEEGSLPKLEGAAWNALQAANRASRTPRFFRFSGMVSDVGIDDHNVPRVRPMNPVRLRSVLGRCARWIRWT